MTGERLGDYTIDRELGAGGMGQVYAATGPDGVVALKVVHPHLAGRPGFLERFRREAQLGQSIRHENVVRTFDCDQDLAVPEPRCFLVMEYVEGQTLSELLGELGRVPEELCRHVAREICRGLVAVHAAGVVHRDLKPENVLITREHVVKIMDLGVAQVADEALRLSRDGAFVGSVEYAAPEQFRGGDVDGRTDLHALGVLLYELSSGRHPYRGGGFHQVLTRVCDEEPRPLGEVNPQLSPFFEEVVHTLLVKNPRGRFASATRLLEVLEAGEESPWWHDRARELQEDTKRPLRRIRIPRETAVYGRDADLATLRELFEKAKVGDGRVVLLEGEAGIGKSRLVDELVARLHADGEDLNFLFGSYPPGGAAAAAGAFCSAFREQLGEAGAAAYLAQTPLLVPAFDALLRGDIAPENARPLERDAVAACFARVTTAMAAERPTILLIDDLHFAPDDARALFAALASAVAGHRVLLVGATRPGSPEKWRAEVTRLAHCALVPVQRLGPKDLAALLRESFRSEHLAELLAYKIATKSDGNPFFAFEIIRGLREGQFITRNADGTWASTREIDDLQIPSSVLDLVNARVAGLTEDERALLDLAACWGYEFDPSLIGEVLGLARIPTLRAFGQIERLHRLVRSVGRHYAFDHHQVQEALYGSLNDQLREEYHAALAEALEARVGAAEKTPETLEGGLCVDLCEHYLKGARGDRAFRYLEPARLHLAAGRAHARAVAIAERALDVPGLLTGAARARVMSLLAEPNGPLDQLGQRAKQLEYALQAEALALEHGDPVQAGWAANALAWIYRITRRIEESRAAAERVLECARTHGVLELEAAACGALGLVLSATGRTDEAIDYLRRNIALWRRVGKLENVAGGILNLASCLRHAGRLSEALEEVPRCIELARDAEARHIEVKATNVLGMTYFLMGRFEEAKTWFERQLSLARELGNVGDECGAHAGLGNVFLRLDRLDDAEAAYRRQRLLSRQIGDRVSEATAQDSLGSVLRRRGRLAEAREALEAQVRGLHDLGERLGEAIALHNLGLMATAGGETARAEKDLRACARICDEIGNRHLAAATLLALGNCLAEAGRRSGGDGSPGRDDLVAARDLARENGFAGYEALASCSLAASCGGDVGEAVAAVDAAEATLTEEELRGARLGLWRLTGDRSHLAAAKRLLDAALERADDEVRRALLATAVARDILAAWAEVEGDREPPGTESVTRVG